VRAKRQPSGLRPQHLACLRGAEAISAGRAQGAEVSSSEVQFTPGEVRPGDYLLEVGSAGSTPLLAQCLFYPLALAGPSRLVLRGGTHVPHSPSHPYLAQVWLTAVTAYGFRASAQLRLAGFYPEGGGELVLDIGARQEPPALVELLHRGTLGQVEVTSFVAGLSFDIAARQGQAAAAALKGYGVACEVTNRPLPQSRSVGTGVFVLASFENTVAGFTALGEKGKSAEKVGAEAAEALESFLAGSGALDEHLADQILLPAALLAAGRLGPSQPGTTRFRTAKVTEHLRTHAEVVQRFLPVEVRWTDDGEVLVAPTSGAAAPAGPR
jgi:RNA 3'-terminal phosphate cyclase (ATP)